MENNYNSNGDSTNRTSSDSLYSYSYVNQNKSAESGSDSQSSANSYNNFSNTSGSDSYHTTGAGEPDYGGSNPAGTSVNSDTAPGNAANSSYYTSGGTSGSNSNFYMAGGNSPSEGSKKKRKEKKPKEFKKHGFGVNLAKCAALALVFGLVGGSVFYGTGYVFDYAAGKSSTQEEASNKLTTNSSDKNGGTIPVTNTAGDMQIEDVSEVVDNVMPSIVSITNLSQVNYQDWFGQTYSQEVPSAGSGIIVAQTDEELYIVTNNHVVAGASTLTVNFVDDETVTAEVKGTDESVDLAVVSIPISEIPAETMSKIKVATLGDSGSLKVGQSAIAIGNALGYGQSVTTGVISALDREVTVEASTGGSITNSLIQTDAAINPGNSGGALLNTKGEVIGINSVKYSDTNVEGMGYAIPISMAEPIINELITRQVVDESQKAYFGITGVDVSTEVSETYNMPQGIYVTQVSPGSAAQSAGINQGDIITSFDGREVSSMKALADRIQYYEAGTTVEVKVMKAQDGGYAEHTLSVTLGKKN